MRNFVQKIVLNHKLKRIKKQANLDYVPIVRPKTKDCLLCELKKCYQEFLKQHKLQHKQNTLASKSQREKPVTALPDFSFEILEIGTSVGYSGINMLLSTKNSHLTTLEKDENVTDKAKLNFENFGLNKRVNFMLGDAWESLNSLNSLGKQYNFIFLDGPKGQYLKYLPILISLLKPNGILFVDDIYYHGWVLNSNYNNHKHRTIVKNLRQFIEQISVSNTLQSQLYNIEDGFAVCKKIN